MKVLLVLALVAFCSTARTTQTVTVDMYDDLLFAFLEGFKVIEKYPNCEICHTATTEITDNFAEKIMAITNSRGEPDKDGIIQASYAMGVIPDFMRHCQGTAGYIINAIDRFTKSFKNFDEFVQKFTENGTIVLAEVVINFRKIGGLKDDNDFAGIARTMGHIIQLIFNFEGTNTLLLAPEPELLRATKTQEDLFINMIRFGTGALKASEIIPDDTEMKICGDSFIQIDLLWSQGVSMLTETPAEGVFTMADSLKELGPLVENCIDTYEDALQNALNKMSQLPEQQQLMLNLFGHINYIVLHLVQTQVSVQEKGDYHLGGSHLGRAFVYLFKEFDPNSDATDGLP